MPVVDALGRRWITALGSLDSGDAQIGAAARELAKAEPIEAARALANLMAVAAEDAATSRVVGALIRALGSSRSEDLPAESREAIAAAASDFGITEVATLFVSAAPARALHEGETLRGDPSTADLSLGHKRQLARSADPDRAAQFVAESDPSVIRNLLLNPRLTEDLVVRIAARRPAIPKTLREIWSSRRWSVRRRVRVALARNPYLEPEVALKILPLLGGADLRGVAEDTTLHAAVRDAARQLIAKRRRRT